MVVLLGTGGADRRAKGESLGHLGPPEQGLAAGSWTAVRRRPPGPAGYSVVSPRAPAATLSRVRNWASRIPIS